MSGPVFNLVVFAGLTFLAVLLYFVALRRTEFGFVFQQHFLINYLTALENVMVSAPVQDKAHAEQAKALLADLGLGDKLHRFPYELSGGERQRVAIARAMIHRPRVIFADEPTGLLDRHTGLQVMGLLRSYRDQGSLIAVTHNPEILSEADLVIKALGFDPEDLPALFDEPALSVNRWGAVKVDYSTMETSLPGVLRIEPAVFADVRLVEPLTAHPVPDKARPVREPFLVHAIMVAGQYPHHLAALGVDPDVRAQRIHHVDGFGLRQFPGPGGEGVGLRCEGADRADLHRVAGEVRAEGLVGDHRRAGIDPGSDARVHPGDHAGAAVRLGADELQVEADVAEVDV